MAITQPLPEADPPQPDLMDEGEIDLRHYLYVLNKYKWSILGLTLAVVLLTALYVFNMEVIYQATATLLIEAQEEKVVSIQEVYGLPSQSTQYFETQNQILQSRELAERVLNTLDLAKHPEFDPAVRKSGSRISLNPLNWIPRDWLPGSASVDGQSSPQHAENALVGNFMGRLKVTPVRNSQLIKISFEAHDAELAAKVPNTLAQTYIESVLEGRLGVTKQAADWIVERLDNLRVNVEKSEQALHQFLERENLVDVQGVDSLANKELTDLTSELTSARKTMSEYEELSRRVEGMQGQPIDAYESIPAVLKDPTVQRAKEQQTQAQLKLSELSKRYGPKHPKMISAVDELNTTKKYLAVQIDNVVKSLAKEYDSARSKVRETERMLNSSREELKQINSKESELRKLQREVEANRQLYDMFLTRYKETNIAGDMKTANARVVDPAVVPTTPYRPNKKVILLIAMVLALFGGTIIAFLIETLDNTIKSSSDVERLLRLPVLSILPKLHLKKDEEGSIMNYVSENSSTKFSENVRTIRTGVLLTGIDDRKKTILVTSSVPSEGKSVVAANLALALGQMGKVLLIDADMRRPTLGGFFNLAQNDSLGLSNFISETEPLDQCIHFFIKRNIYVMPCGVIPPNPLELLSSKRFQLGLEKIIEAFDYVVLDSPPIIAVSDSVVMSQYVNGIVYVVKADDTAYQLVIDGLKRLRQVNAPVVGVVLNQVAPPKKSGRYGHYSGDYHHYYGYDKN